MKIKHLLFYKDFFRSFIKSPNLATLPHRSRTVLKKEYVEATVPLDAPTLSYFPCLGIF